MIRELANRVLDGGSISDSDRFKEIVDAIKAAVPLSQPRAFFIRMRLALAGRTGEGELDRVILLLDSAAKLRFSVKVKVRASACSNFAPLSISRKGGVSNSSERATKWKGGPLGPPNTPQTKRGFSP